MRWQRGWTGALEASCCGMAGAFGFERGREI